MAGAIFPDPSRRVQLQHTEGKPPCNIIGKRGFRPHRSLQLVEIYKMSSWTFVSNLQKVHLAPPEPRQAGLVTPVHVHALCWRPVSRVGAPPTASSCQFVCLLSVRVPLVTIFFRVSDRVRVSSSFKIILLYFLFFCFGLV